MVWHVNNLRGLFNATTIRVEEQLLRYLTDNKRDKGVHAFPEGISLSERNSATLKSKSSTLPTTPRGLPYSFIINLKLYFYE